MSNPINSIKFYDPDSEGDDFVSFTEEKSGIKVHCSMMGYNVPSPTSLNKLEAQQVIDFLTEFVNRK